MTHQTAEGRRILRDHILGTLAVKDFTPEEELHKGCEDSLRFHFTDEDYNSAIMELRGDGMIGYELTSHCPIEISYHLMADTASDKRLGVGKQIAIIFENAIEEAMLEVDVVLKREIKG